MISNDAYNAIAALDFAPIKFKLMHERFGEGWSKAKADAVETEYRRFLYLQSAFPNESTAPSLDVDTFWHYHILDTMKYASDCQQAFGHFLHHYPYLGLLDDDAPGVDVAAAKRTRELYEATFGEPYLRAEAYHEDRAETGDSAHCQGMCMAKPAAAARASARCQTVCMATRPM